MKINVWDQATWPKWLKPRRHTRVGFSLFWVAIFQMAVPTKAAILNTTSTSCTLGTASVSNPTSCTIASSSQTLAFALAGVQYSFGANSLLVQLTSGSEVLDLGPTNVNGASSANAELALDLFTGGPPRVGYVLVTGLSSSQTGETGVANNTVSIGTSSQGAPEYLFQCGTNDEPDYSCGPFGGGPYAIDLGSAIHIDFKASTAATSVFSESSYAPGGEYVSIYFLNADGTPVDIYLAPEPGTWGMVALGAALFVCAFKRQQPICLRRAVFAAS